MNKIVSNLSFKILIKLLTQHALVEIFIRVLGVVFTVVAANYLDKENLGIYLTSYGLLLLLGTLISNGAPSALNHYTTILHSKGHIDTSHRLLSSTLSRLLIYSSIASIIIINYSDWISLHLYDKINLSIGVKIVGIVLPFYVFSETFNSYFQGIHLTSPSKIINELTWKIIGLLSIGSIIIFNLSPEIIYWSMLYTEILIVLSYLAYYYHKSKKHITFTLLKKNKSFISYSMNNWVSQISNILSSRIDIVVLSFFLPLKEIATIAVAMSLSSILNVMTKIIGPIYRPIARSLITKGEINSLIDYHSKLVKITISLITPIVLFTLFFANEIFHLFFNTKYDDSILIFKILVLGHIPRAILGPNNPTLLALSKVKLVKIIDLISMISMILFLIIIVPFFGAIGAAIVISLVFFTGNFLKSYFLRKIIPITIFPNSLTIFYLLSSIVFCCFIFFLKENLNFYGGSWELYALLFLFFSGCLLLSFIFKQLTWKNISIVKGLRFFR